MRVCVNCLYYSYQHSYTNNIINILYIIFIGIIYNTLYDLLYTCRYIPAYIFRYILFIYKQLLIYKNNTKYNYYNMFTYTQVSVCILRSPFACHVNSSSIKYLRTYLTRLELLQEISNLGFFFKMMSKFSSPTNGMTFKKHYSQI